MSTSRLSNRLSPSSVYRLLSTVISAPRLSNHPWSTTLTTLLLLLLDTRYSIMKNQCQREFNCSVQFSIHHLTILFIYHPEPTANLQGINHWLWLLWLTWCLHSCLSGLSAVCSCMYVWMNEWMYVCNVCMYVCMYVSKYVQYVCMYVLYCTVLYCTVLYCTVLYCTVLYCMYVCTYGSVMISGSDVVISEKVIQWYTVYRWALYNNNYNYK